jgi:quinoprotein glucose dehydrogenase
VAAAGAAVEAVPAESGYFTEEQAERGRAAFREVCSECHYSSEFRGAQFEFEWKRRTARDLFRTISRTMPEDAPGSLAPGQYADVVSYLLQLNGLPAGGRELPADAEALRAYSLAGLGRGGG